MRGEQINLFVTTQRITKKKKKNHFCIIFCNVEHFLIQFSYSLFAVDYINTKQYITQTDTCQLIRGH